MDAIVTTQSYRSFMKDEGFVEVSHHEVKIIVICTWLGLRFLSSLYEHDSICSKNLAIFSIGYH